MTATKRQKTIELDPNRLMRILHIDDKPEVLKATREALEVNEYSVESVLSPMDAIKQITIEKKKFEVAIVDILFQQTANSISGIEFVSKSKPFLKDMIIMAYTGHQDKIKKEQLSLFNGGIFLKGREEDELYETIDQLFNDKVKKIEAGIYEDYFNGNGNQYDLSKAYYKRQQKRLIEELESVEGDEVLVVTGDRSITAKELLEEIKRETEIGKRHVNLLLDYLDSKRGVQNGKE